MNAATASTSAGSATADRTDTSPFDNAFSALIARLQRGIGGEASAQAAELALWARRTGHAVLAGHVCLDLTTAAGNSEALARALAVLRASPLVGCDQPGRPLVLSASDRLYLERYWCYETALAAALRERAASPPALDLDRTALAMQRYCGPDSGLNSAQRRAAALVLTRRLAVISGGPGTGKTTTIARALCALRDLHGESYKIALAAPTGKAAARLTQAVHDGLARMSFAGDSVPGGLAPPEGVTLHRLLGLGRLRRRAGQSSQLAVDCLVIDEASMLDLALAAMVTRALPISARLVLLGDHDQLSSVEAGAVMASLCSRRSGYSEGAAQVFARVTGEAPPIAPAASPLEDSLVVLRESFRFQEAGALGRLAARIRDGDAAGSLDLLESAPRGEPPGALSWRSDPSPAALMDGILEGYAGFLESVRGRRPPAEVFAAAERFRVLCAVRAGPYGVERINAAIERRIRPSAARTPDWYAGRMVMVSVNDYGARLYNGDVGIVLHDDSGSLALWVLGEGGGFRRIPPARLPAHETAFAITVHKSQGSEFDRVLVVLPPEPAPVVTRELLYTGVSRARTGVSLFSSRATLESAIQSRQTRDSGLSELLHGG